MIKIEIDVSKLERGTHEGRVKVMRGGKTFYRKQRVGRKEKPVEKKSVEKVISDYEMTIKDMEIEFCGAVQPDGNLVFTKSGERDRIGFDEFEKSLMKGTVFTHNHPVGHSFSDADIKWACLSEMKEMRVITSHGMSFTMKRRDGENLSEDLWKSKISLTYSAVNNEKFMMGG